MVKRALAGTVALVLLAGCATSTAPGAVGVSRTQLLMMPSAQIEQQAALGYRQISSAAMKAGTLNQDSTVTERVRVIAKRLIKEVTIYRPEAKSWQWEINVFTSPKINATCMPGGKIAIFTGLIDKLQATDNELAAVIGHEIAHALREHTREKVSNAFMADSMVKGIAQSGSRNAGLAGGLAGIGATLFFQLPFSREMESEADIMGLELMARAGYDPEAALTFWQKMQTVEKDTGKTDFFHTHPSSDNRISSIKAAMPKVLPLYTAKLYSNGKSDLTTGIPANQPTASQAASFQSPTFATPAAPTPRAFRPASCDLPNVKQGVGAC
ncbi:M48 family metallopeptidase [Caenimonas soli]|uniref:M48 family metallopeptidase n=1 Tax=Caenimonas soli TaxID=2735555 RepID=UPI001555B4E0|nr:M48 family metallopeptidase [Caenimonas soli]NPC56664.1 M48 family metallopeptidase [Caenimonas soli]